MNSRELVARINHVFIEKMFKINGIVFGIKTSQELLGHHHLQWLDFVEEFTAYHKKPQEIEDDQVIRAAFTCNLWRSIVVISGLV